MLYSLVTPPPPAGYDYLKRVLLTSVQPGRAQEVYGDESHRLTMATRLVVATVGVCLADLFTSAEEMARDYANRGKAIATTSVSAVSGYVGIPGNVKGYLETHFCRNK